MGSPKSIFYAWLSWGMGWAIVLVTFLSLLSYVAWHPYLELTSHFKVQYFLISLVFLIGLLVLRLKWWILIALFCLTIQFIEIIPWYLPSANIAPSSQHDLRILSSNVYVRNQNPYKFLDLVEHEQPDLVIILEKTPRWLESVDSLRNQFPYFFQAPDDIAIFSRIPLENPTIFGEHNQSNIATTLTINGQKVQLVAAHPPPPMGNLADARNAELIEIANHIQQQKDPIILIGDLNTTMWSPYYKQLKQKTGLKNARHGYGILPTWPAPTPYAKPRSLVTWVKPLLWIPIDHCLVSPEIHVRSLRAGSNIDSDHLPLIADLAIQPG